MNRQHFNDLKRLHGFLCLSNIFLCISDQFWRKRLLSNNYFEINPPRVIQGYAVVPIINDTHREILVFHSIQYRNGWLAASHLFDMFTQSVKFYTFHYQYRCLKNVIHQIDSKNGWLLLLASLRQNLVFLRGFIFMPTERA